MDSKLALLLALFALWLVGAGPDRAPEADPDDGELPFDEARVFFELNDTDGDLGLHALIDGEEWKQVQLRSPDGREDLRVTTRGSLRTHGLTELFLESAEPSFDELDPEEFFERFPEGTWELTGTTIERDPLASEVLVRHVLPAPPTNVLVSGERAAPDCDAEPLPSVGEPVVIGWDPVLQSHPTIGRPGAIEVVGYQLVVEREEPALLRFSVDLPADVTEFELPEEFTRLGDAFKFEILVREATGNQTAVESCFEIQ